MRTKFVKVIFGLMMVVLLSACNEVKSETGSPSNAKTTGLEIATFAGGCFWCMETPYEKLNGVKSVVSGYMGGNVNDPTYKQVSSGGTGHAEVVQITYDPEVISYNKLLEVFWKNINPTDGGGQFVDRGNQYRSEVFFHDEQQRKLAEESRKKLESSGIFKNKIVTAISKAGPFYRAEEYHQDYYKKSPVRYEFYRYNSGRDQFLSSVWEGKTFNLEEEKGRKYARPSLDKLKKILSPMQYKVTQEEGTEPPFKNEYWDNKKEGIYVDVVSGEPLFSSTHKFKSGTGWPSFFRPLEKNNVVEKSDTSWGMTRIEVRSKHGNSHLGHVFNDGPQPTGLRYCINSASLKFIPKDMLKQEGYEEYLALFE